MLKFVSPGFIYDGYQLTILMEIFCIMILVGIIQLYIIIKTHLFVYLNLVKFIEC